jgi:FlaA1/EpsC-like NDP-sugar epimerase
MALNSGILTAILQREKSFLTPDIEGFDAVIRESVYGSRVLVIGAAGSIGGAFVKELIPYEPEVLDLIDISENNLAEVVRDLRSSGVTLPPKFATYSLDYGGPEMRALLEKNHYDYVLNFSALKHVRSERDPFTLMRLLEVNVLSNARLIGWLKETHVPRKIFAVSSDKAVRSGNLMGGSKAFMERVFLAHSDEIPFGSARFANVAFSDGSLLHGFKQRLEKRQPITAPNDVKRYFISHQEAGQLCLLGCFAGRNREITYSDFRPDRDMLTFSEIAKVFLKESGYQPFECASEEEALEMAANLDESSTDWPCYFSSTDTSGEKPYEEFVDPSEETDASRFSVMGVITKPVDYGAERTLAAVEELKALRESGQWTIEEIATIVKRAVPEINHVQSARNLDQKM